MPEEVAKYIVEYGYLAVFIMVFQQETGFPNPVPNELLLVFSGYLSYKGMLSFPIAVLTVITADLTGTIILYLIFRYAGKLVLNKKPRWLTFPKKTFDKLRFRIQTGGDYSIIIFRLTPFTRGYTSVLSGLLGIKPAKYFSIAAFTAILWTLFYISAGYLIGPSWTLFSNRISDFKLILICMLIITLIIVSVMLVSRKLRKRTRKMIPEFESTQI